MRYNLYLSYIDYSGRKEKIKESRSFFGKSGKTVKDKRILRPRAYFCGNILENIHIKLYNNFYNLFSTKLLEIFINKRG